jgi:hypothetical protein
LNLKEVPWYNNLMYFGTLSFNTPSYHAKENKNSIAHSYETVLQLSQNTIIIQNKGNTSLTMSIISRLFQTVLQSGSLMATYLQVFPTKVFYTCTLLPIVTVRVDCGLNKWGRGQGLFGSPPGSFQPRGPISLLSNIQ